MLTEAVTVCGWIWYFAKNIFQKGKHIILFGKKKKINLKIGGMHCEHCAAKVKKAVKELGGKADVDIKLGRATVTCPEAMDEEAICEAVTKLGFTCEIA